MTTIHIIETDTIREGDLVAFNFGDHGEVAGLVKKIDAGIFSVKTIGFGLVEVPEYEITDIC